jgi:hypothetical protein
MNKIFKYQIDVATHQTLLAPAHSKFLSIQLQHGYLTMWLEVDEKMPNVNFNIYVAPTGGVAPFDCKYLGTVQLTDGTAWHVYSDGDL